MKIQNIHRLHGTQSIETLALNSVFECSLLSSLVMSRVASPNHTCCVLFLEVGGGGGGGGSRAVLGVTG